ncbi:class I SAM-dependent methyltransferase [Demetria terragena]|uniref:class I SAM-dependent methyltransferase n=1 Tax=Demetria terragena TaxID=63959 RepID=UPI00037CDA6B|nr:class I SAM-dependent methyltransferase [Demetria terragena]
MASEHPGHDRVRDAYDVVATDYAAAMRDELDDKPLDRALLSAVVEMARGGPIVDIGCGPGQVAGHLAALGGEVLGVDISASMIEIARAEQPEAEFEVGSMTDLQQSDASIAAAVLMYSIIHLSPADRDYAIREVRRILRPGGIALLAFHIRSEEFAAGEVNHLTSWFGHSVDVEGYFLEPEVVLNDLARHGLDIVSIMTRLPHPQVEFPSERAYVIAQRPED